MRPADKIERLLDRLEDHTSSAFDEPTLRDMFDALDEAMRTSPVRSWRSIAREIMNSRITKLAAAAVLVIAVLLLARHLIGRDTMVTPEYRNPPIASVPGDEDGRVGNQTIKENEQLRLAREHGTAQELFAKSDTGGLLRLLNTGLDQTKITVAGYLAQLGDEAALPALQRLADLWQGPAEENPFRKSIEQIQSTSPRQDKIGSEGLSQEQTHQDGATAAIDGPHIVIRVTEKATGEPIPQAMIRVVAGNEDQMHAADDQGVFILDLRASIPDYLRISVAQEGYVWQGVTLKGLSREKLPKTVQFSLEKGVIIGAVVQDSDGHAIEGVSISSSISEEQQFDQPCVSVRMEEKTDAQGHWRWGNVPRGIERLWFNVSHPDFADGGFEMPGDLKLDDLRAERAVMVLNKGIAVTGRVTDMAGKPVAGAKLLAGEDYYARDWTQTDGAGHFEFPHLRTLNRSFLLTVQAPGYTPQRRELPSENGLAPADFFLEPAKVLIGRVVDSAGKPVEGAYVGSEEWNSYRTVKWDRRTDAKGMFVWDYPPDDAVRIRISKSGYREFEQEVVANDQEQTFVIAKPMTIKGSVTNSETGETVKQFKVTPGIHWNGGNRATWQTSESWVKWFTDGRYSYTFSADGQAYAVRIEADGYAPAESRFVDANELEVTIDITLTKGRGPSSYVYDANAAPVAGAEVFWEKDIWIQNGQVVNRTHRIYVKTDGDGHFTFKPENREDPLLAICDRGVGVASYEDLARDGIITLTPWARVQGDLRIGTRPAVNKRLQLTHHARLTENSGSPGNEATTDENGRFVFERVYPGGFSLYNQAYEVAPGQTLELHLGGTGRTVKGELAVPGPSDILLRPDLNLVSVNAQVPPEVIPKPAGYEQMSLDEVRAWLTRFGESQEGKAYNAWRDKMYPQKRRIFRVEMDGRSTFHVDNVEPGVYVLTGGIYHEPLGDGAGVHDVVGRLWHQFEVRPFTNPNELDTPLDLGTVPVLPGELKPGDPAPAFDVPASGPGRVRLADYRGKVLLVTFLGWGFVEPDSTAVQDLKGVYQRFHESPHYAQISLLLTGHPLLDKKATEEAALEWPHRLLEGQERTGAEYDVRTVPWNILIGPQGEVLAVGLSGEALPQAVEKALSALR